MNDMSTLFFCDFCFIFISTNILVIESIQFDYQIWKYIMYISKVPKMDQPQTPRAKVTRFSEHPQVFEYSSKSKRQNSELDNDSLLLDNNMDIEEPTQIQQNQNLCERPADQIDFSKKESEIQELASQFAEIEAYLNTQSEPIVYFSPEKQPEQQSNRISTKNKPSLRTRLSFNVKADPNQNNGRETMNIEQQQKLKSQLKSMPPSQKKLNSIPQKNQELKEQKSKLAKDISEQIKEEVNKKNRITMDVNSLLNMINSYEREESERKYRESRKNRITLDVFALSKMVENMDEEHRNDEYIKQQIDNENMVTPIKKPDNPQQSYRKSKIFSAYKNNPSESQLSLEITKYLSEVSERIKMKNKQTAHINQFINEIASQENKLKIKIQAIKQQIARDAAIIEEKKQYRDKLRKRLEECPYEQHQKRIKLVEEQYGFEIIKYERERQPQQTTTIAHINLNGIFLKMKSRNQTQFRLNNKIQTQHTDLKIMYTREAKELQKIFLFSIEENTKILKKYHYKYLSELSNGGNLLEIAKKLKIAFQNMKILDLELQYLSINFESRNFEINSALEMLDFDIIYPDNFHVMVKLNILEYIHDRSNQETFSIYDVDNHKYLNILKEASPEFQEKDSLLLTMMRKLIEYYL